MISLVSSAIADCDSHVSVPKIDEALGDLIFLDTVADMENHTCFVFAVADDGSVRAHRLRVVRRGHARHGVEGAGS